MRKLRWDRIMEMLADGVPQIVIADKFKTDVNTIAVYDMVRLGTDYKFSVSYDGLQSAIFKRADADDVKRIVDLHEKGYSCPKIAEMIGRSDCLVKRALIKTLGKDWHSKRIMKMKEADSKIADEVLALYRAKYTPAKIVKMTGYEDASVRRIIKAYNKRELRKRRKNEEHG